MKRFLLRLARLVAIAYVSLMFIVAGCQSRMLYHPLVRPESALLEEAKERGVTSLQEFLSLRNGKADAHVQN